LLNDSARSPSRYFLSAQGDKVTWEGAVCGRKDKPRGDIQGEKWYALFTDVSEVRERSYCQVFARLLASFVFSSHSKSSPKPTAISAAHVRFRREAL